MIDKYLNYSKVIIFTLTVLSCSDGGKTEDKIHYDKIQVDTAIARIANDVVDLTSPGELLLIPNFINIYSHPKVYRKDIITYLSIDTVSDLNKTIAVYSLKKMSESDYIDFAIAASNLYLKGKISEKIMSDIIYTVKIKNFSIVKNYNTLIVKDMLIKIISHPGASKEFIKRNNRVFSGEVWRNVK